MFSVYLDTQVTSLNESATPPHEYVQLLKRCAPLILLLIFPLTFSRGLSALSEYLTTSGLQNPSSSCPVNSEINCNHISMLIDWTYRIALTDNSSSLYRKVFIWLFHDTVVPWHRPSSKQLSWYSGHVTGTENRSLDHWSWVVVLMTRVQTYNFEEKGQEMTTDFIHRNCFPRSLLPFIPTFALPVLAIALWEGEGGKKALAMNEEEQTVISIFCVI